MSKPSVNIVLLSTAFVLGAALGVLGDRTLLATPPVASDEPEAAAPVAAVPAPAPVETPAPAAKEDPAPAPVAEPVEVAAVEDDDGPKAEPMPPRGPGRRGRMGGFQLPSPAQIAMAKMAWTAAQGPVYAKAHEMLGLDEAGQAQLKEVVAGMSEKLTEVMETLAANLREQENIFEPSPELMTRAVGEMATVVASTYDAVGELVPEDRRREVEKVELFRLTDPNAMNPMINLMNERMGGQKEGNQSK